MISKGIIDSMRDDFNEKFGRLSNRSRNLTEAIRAIKKQPGVKGLSNEHATLFEDNLYAIISAASVLGYYIGLQEGADMIQSLSSADLPEKLLDAFNELAHYGGSPL